MAFPSWVILAHFFLCFLASLILRSLYLLCLLAQLSFQLNPCLIEILQSLEGWVIALFFLHLSTLSLMGEGGQMRGLTAKPGHDPILQMSSSAAPWNIFTCNQGPTSLGVGCGKMPPEPSHLHGKAQPNVPAKPSAGQPLLRSQSRPKDGPDPVNYPCRWMSVEMSRLGTPTLTWWKEIRASRRPFRSFMKEGHSDYQVQHFML